MLGRLAATVAVLAAVSTTMGAAPAAAEPQSGYPYGCYSGALRFYDNYGGYSYCEGGRGQHRVKITCQRAATPWIQDILYGPWVGSTVSSDRMCLHTYDPVLTHSYQVRSG